MISSYFFSKSDNFTILELLLCRPPGPFGAPLLLSRPPPHVCSVLVVCPLLPCILFFASRTNSPVAPKYKCRCLERHILIQKAPPKTQMSDKTVTSLVLAPQVSGAVAVSISFCICGYISHQIPHLLCRGFS